MYKCVYPIAACPFTLCRGFFTPKIVGTFYMQGYKVKEKTAIVPHCTPVSKLSGHPEQMQDPVLHFWLKFQRNTKQIYDCPRYLGYMLSCQVICQYLIPLLSSLCNVIYTQNDIVRDFFCNNNNILVIQQHMGFCSVMVAIFGFSIHINRIKKVYCVRDHSRIRNLKAHNNNNGSKVMTISHMVLGKVI